MNIKFSFLLLLSFYDVSEVYGKAKLYEDDYDIDVKEEYRYVSLVGPPKLPTPEVHVHFIDQSTLRTKINGLVAWFVIRSRVWWPGKVNIDSKGRVELRFRKKRFQYKNANNRTSVQKMFVLDDNKIKTFPTHWVTEVVDKSDLTYDTCLLTVRYSSDVYNYLGVGRHFSIKQNIQGRDREYQYTPVPKLPLISLNDPNPNPREWRDLNQEFYLYVKSYHNGTLSKWLCERRLGQPIIISNPQGSFCPVKELTGMKRIFLIGAGTGLTPLLSVMLWALQTMKTVEIKLYFFNRMEKDIAWRKELNDVTKLDNRFSVEHILSQPKDTWTGRKGRITLDLVQELFPKNRSKNGKSKNYFAICGQPQFTANTMKWLEENMGYKRRNVYGFMGQ